MSSLLSLKQRCYDAGFFFKRVLIERTYRRKQEYPDEIANFDKEARAKLQGKCDGKRLSFESLRMGELHEIQQAARRASTEVLGVLASMR
jgi:hypothetical protein